jgi:hypothetical protein
MISHTHARTHAHTNTLNMYAINLIHFLLKAGQNTRWCRPQRGVIQTNIRARLGNSVVKATGYRLDGPGIESR